MASTGHHHPIRESRVLTVLSETFWLLVLAVIVLFAFFLALGTFSISEVGWVAGAVGVLVVLWLVHAWLQGRSDTRADPRRGDAVRQRERRGF